VLPIGSNLILALLIVTRQVNRTLTLGIVKPKLPHAPMHVEHEEVVDVKFTQSGLVTHHRATAHKKQDQKQPHRFHPCSPEVTKKIKSEGFLVTLVNGSYGFWSKSIRLAAI
jgi:hypothetical protein